MGFDRTMIDRFENGADDLKRAVAGLMLDDFRALPVPGTWSIQQIVIHLADSDLIGVDRMKRTIAEENPTLIGYNESLFAKKLFYDEQSVEDAVTLFAVNRKQFVRILRKLPDAAFDRIATHNEAGQLTLGKQLKKHNEHLEHHLKFLLDKRKMLGK